MTTPEEKYELITQRLAEVLGGDILKAILAEGRSPKAYWELIRKKVKAAFCEEGNVEDNGVLAFVNAVLIPISQLRIDRQKGDSVLEAGLGDQRPFISDDAPDGTVFTMERDEKHGGNLHYASFDELEVDFKEKKVHPKDLKTVVANGIARLLEPIRKAFEENEEWQKIEKLAYPDPNAKPEKKKKKHDGPLASTSCSGVNCWMVRINFNVMNVNWPKMAALFGLRAADKQRRLPTRVRFAEIILGCWRCINIFLLLTMTTPEEKYELITQRLAEVLGGDILKAILAEGRSPKAYWGSAPTGRPHIGYLVALTKIADFLRAGVEVKILLADVHAFLDNLKAPLELVAYRTKYYEFLLTTVFTSLGIPISRLQFVQGSTYQLTREYNMDNYKLCATVTEHDAKKAGAEVVKQVESPLLSGLLYPGLQALDEQYLDVDFQFGGVDQRKIFTFAELYLPRLGYKKRAHLMNAMVPGLAELIRKKVKAAFCEEGNVEDNGVLAFVNAVLIPISQLRIDRQKGDSVLEAGLGDQRPFISDDAPDGTVFTMERDEKHGGNLHYASFDELEVDFKEKKVHPKDLKTVVANGIARLLEPIRKAFEENEEWQKIERLAYPDPNAKPEKKKKKEKVYHPPPPGKGKNTQKPTENGDATTAPAPTPTEVQHAVEEAAKQSGPEPVVSVPS
ncbi:Tyrosine--tRNA ligase, cytoplasmic [Leucoagaricus sp. SymC.cos]|nr:Tyrosine--tRNA ligase, cytoplasmic [Leucoagaricus sp. SymC.cos]